MYEYEIALLFIILGLSSFFSGAESALLSLSLLQLKRLSKIKKPANMALVQLKASPRRMIMTVLIGNTLTNIAASFIVADLTDQIFGVPLLGVAAGALVLFMLVFCEIMPKTYAISDPEKISLAVAPTLLVFQLLFKPVTMVLESIESVFPGIFPNIFRRHRFSEEEIRNAMEYGVEDKAISREEHDLLERVLDFNDVIVKEIMVSKDQVKCLYENDSQEEVAKKLSKFRKNRYPVLSASGNVVGVLSIKKFLASEDKMLSKMMDKPFFTSKEAIAYDLFKRMQKTNTHLAVAIDPGGNFEGIVTIEDLLEEIVGEIHEGPEQGVPTQLQEEKPMLLISGSTRLHDIEKELGITIAEAERFGSIAAYMHYRLRRIPVKGDTVMLADARFEVKEVRDNAIEKIQATRMKQA